MLYLSLLPIIRHHSSCSFRLSATSTFLSEQTAYQPPVLFSQNKLAISNQATVLFSQNKSAPAISHQPNEQAFF
jgi:hypothetical protein